MRVADDSSLSNNNNNNELSASGSFPVRGGGRLQGKPIREISNRKVRNYTMCHNPKKKNNSAYRLVSHLTRINGGKPAKRFQRLGFRQIFDHSKHASVEFAIDMACGTQVLQQGRLVERSSSKHRE